uniref:Cnidarian restricted protein n=1 Tax=Clytia hemisphaerica TaxID=252671 RepID=A0A7M5U8M0_9CNID
MNILLHLLVIIAGFYFLQDDPNSQTPSTSLIIPGASAEPNAPAIPILVGAGARIAIKHIAKQLAKRAGKQGAILAAKSGGAEHTKGKRKSTEGKHEKGQARKNKDQGRANGKKQKGAKDGSKKSKKANRRR